MRLATRMSATFVGASLLVFGAYGAWLVVSEARDLRRSAEREAIFLATSLRVGIENALRDRQLPDVEEATLRLEGVDTDVDVYVFDPQGAPVVAPGGMPTGELRERLVELVHRAATSQETAIAYGGEALPRRLLLATPLLSDDGDPLGALGIVRPLDDTNADLYRTWGAVASTIGSFVLLAATLGLVVGERRLGRPLGRLAEALGKVRQGRLTDPLPEEGDDEIVVLSREFNAMLRDLAEARATAEAETEARREAMRSLQAADRLVTLGQLSAAVAHEIGSPLQVLHGRARALQARPEDIEHTRRAASVLVQESERITRIVSQLLSLTRRQPVRREPTDASRAAGTVVALLELEARRRKVGLAFAPTGVEVLVADPDQVHQVLLNLLTNALAACRPGGTVRLAVTGTEERVRIEVEDDGVGMDEETRRRALEPLFTTRGAEGGAGLGLAVVQGIVREHGGSLAFTTAVGRGTRFVVDWPRGGVS